MESKNPRFSLPGDPTGSTRSGKSQVKRIVLKTLSLLTLAIGVILVLRRTQSESRGVAVQSWWWPFPWPHPKRDEPQNGEIRWDKDCGDKTSSPQLECGTLYAPLDYTSANDTRQARISIIRYKAGGGKTKREDVLGSLLVNPGGPGGSGVGLVANPLFTNITDRNLAGKYDLVSFDPRGVGHTWPRVQCFKDSDASSYFTNTGNSYGKPGHHGAKLMKHEIGYLLADLKLLGDVCKDHPDSELFQYMSTAFGARDMNLLHKALGDEKINYWGFSYGSVLGSTYAAMFPNEINRLAIDGVPNVFNYYEGLWNHKLVDTDGALVGFFTECVKSGVDNCKLASLVSQSEEDLKTVVMQWAERLKINPIPVANASPPRLLTHTDVLTAFFENMYSPRSWPRLADGLYASIKEGNHTYFLQPINLHPNIYPGGEEPYAIACGDARGSTPSPEDDWSIEQLEKFMQKSSGESRYFSAFFSELAPMCLGSWKFRGVERYNGSFRVNTSFPLLVLGNDFDPVTSGRYADMMSAEFSGSVSVRRAGYGHCSNSQPSQCIDRITHNYFVNGELPAPGTYCDVDSGPFDTDPETSPANTFIIDFFKPRLR